MSQNKLSSRLSIGADRQKLVELISSQLKILLEQGNVQSAKSILIPAQAVDIADAIEFLPETMQAIAFRILAKDKAIAVYEYLEPDVQQFLLEDFKRQDVREIIEQMSPDDRARLFDELPAKVVRRLLIHLSSEEREATALLLGYQPFTAGRVMTPEYISLKEEWTVTQVLAKIRDLAPTSETIYVLYVTDASHHLTGNISLRELVMAQPETLIREIMNRNVICVHTDTSQEEVARTLQRYDFVALPVVDRENRLVGIVTVDDVIDILQAETTKDIHSLGGVQAGDNHYFRSNLFSIVQRRILWLIVVLATSSLGGIIIKAQEQMLEKAIVLLVFIPLVIDIGGSVGNQSSTVVIRGLNTQTFGNQGIFGVIRRETFTGIVLGLLLALGATFWSLVLQDDLAVAIVVGLSLLIISILSTLTGAILPFLFTKLNLDPALMSAPFITTFVDVIGILIYFYIAKWILGL